MRVKMGQLLSFRQNCKTRRQQQQQQRRKMI
jgi:hypothetical protein